MAVVQTFARRQKPQWLRATEAATAALSIRRKVKWTHVYNTFSVVRQSSQSTQTFPFNKTDKPSLSIWRCQQGTLFDILSLYRKPISLLSVIPFIIIIVVVVVIFSSTSSLDRMRGAICVHHITSTATAKFQGTKWRIGKSIPQAELDRTRRGQAVREIK